MTCLQIPAGAAQRILGIRGAESCALDIVSILNHWIVSATHLAPIVSLQRQSMQLMMPRHSMLHFKMVRLQGVYLHHLGRQAAC